MPAQAPLPLPENAGLAFPGETAWPPALLTEREATRHIAIPNPCGRPNTDILRRRLAVVDGEPVAGWQIDFPAHFTAQEAALYAQPFALLQKRSGGAWLSPHADPALRRALARVTRWLATPAAAAEPDWRWIEEEVLPDATLVVVARDDDFTHGLLQSRPLVLWWQAWRPKLPPAAVVGSFPFPWPPATLLSALSKTQEEHRHAVARAARSGQTDALDAAVSAAYGWPPDLDDKARLDHLLSLHRRRAG